MPEFVRLSDVLAPGFDTPTVWFRYLVSIRPLRGLLNPRDCVGYSTGEKLLNQLNAAMSEGYLDQFGDEV